MHEHPFEEARDHIVQRAPAFRHFLEYRLRKGERYGLGFTVGFLTTTGALALFLYLVTGVLDPGTLHRLDLSIAQAREAVVSPELTALVIFVTDLGGGLGTSVGAILVGLLLLFSRRWWALLGLVVATGGGGLVALGLKLIFRRARPVEKIVEAGGYSFPSGHAFSAMVFFGFIIYLAWKHLHHPLLRPLVIGISGLLLVAIGLSRVYLNVHWFTDVIGGFTAGFVWLVASILIVRYAERPRAPNQVP